MDIKYWTERGRVSSLNARDAATSEARLVHLDLAGRYSVLAARAAEVRRASEASAAAAQRPSVLYYEQLEIGARWLASRCNEAGERATHLAMAVKYARLRLETAVAARAGSRS